MKAAIYKKQSKDSSFLEIEEIDKPVLNGSEALVKVRGCGVCGSDLLKLNRSLVQEGTVLGHEMVGQIEAISPDIADEIKSKYNLEAGDRIISSHHVPCGKCNFCLNGKESLCKQFKATNFEPGAFCEYLKLSKAHLEKTVQKIPDEISDQDASFTEPIACCIKAIKKSRLLEHKGSCKAVVIGLGSVGQIIGQLIQHYKHSSEESTLVGCDLLESKLKLAQENGFDEVKDKLENEQADFIFLAGGADATIDLALKNIKDGGTIVVFSSVPNTELGFSNNDIYYKELSIVSSYSPNLEDLQESLVLLKDKKINVSNLITHRSNLDSLGKTIKEAQDENGIKVYLEI